MLIFDVNNAYNSLPIRIMTRQIKSDNGNKYKAYDTNGRVFHNATQNDLTDNIGRNTSEWELHIPVSYNDYTNPQEYTGEYGYTVYPGDFVIIDPYDTNNVDFIQLAIGESVVDYPGFRDLENYLAIEHNKYSYVCRVLKVEQYQNHALTSLIPDISSDNVLKFANEIVLYCESVDEYAK